jgi:hypothetical protein
MRQSPNEIGDHAFDFAGIDDEQSAHVFGFRNFASVQSIEPYRVLTTRLIPAATICG